MVTVRLIIWVLCRLSSTTTTTITATIATFHSVYV